MCKIGIHKSDLEPSFIHEKCENFGKGLESMSEERKRELIKFFFLGSRAIIFPLFNPKVNIKCEHTIIDNDFISLMEIVMTESILKDGKNWLYANFAEFEQKRLMYLLELYEKSQK